MKSKMIAAFAIIGLLAFAQTLTVQAQEKEKKKGRGNFGTVKKIEGKNLTVAQRERGKKETTDKSYTIADGCKVTSGDDAKTLSDVKEGALVGLTVNDKGEVTEIRLVTRKKKDNA